MASPVLQVIRVAGSGMGLLESTSDSQRRILRWAVVPYLGVKMAFYDRTVEALWPFWGRRYRPRREGGECHPTPTGYRIWPRPRMGDGVSQPTWGCSFLEQALRTHLRRR